MLKLKRIGILLTMLFAFTVFASAGSALAAGIGVTPQQGSYSDTYTYTGSGFAANETLSVSAHFLDGTIIALPSVSADVSGNVQFVVTPQSIWHDGTVMVTVSDQSGHSFSAGFHLVHNYVAGSASVSPTSGTYATTFTFQASGFAAGELVDVAAFLQNGSGVGLPAVSADGSGNVSFGLMPYTEWPVGQVTIVASGSSSARKVSAAFQLAQATNGISTSAWYGEYYNNTALTGDPALTRTDGTLSFYWGSGSPDGAIAADNFSARWTATTTVSDSTNYIIQTTSDDGMRVWIDGTLVIDAWTDHAATAYNATIYLTSGSHSLKVEYYERTEQAVAAVNIVR